ncbi:glycosyltransferase [Halomicrobium sp. LC1Hm]|uniref:glycosyltransferase n=1 Tax=Halomicrobium sp. LC1Hm TaxID=2610902 RepID=UPI0012982A52|nr:glycosyltransferase [Halomicrobium sp. LC1Hm]
MTGITAVVRLYRDNTVTGFERTMDSLLAQSCQPDEILVVEDPRTRDNVSSRAQSYSAEYPKMVRVYRIEPTNRGGALKAGVCAANTDLVAILDCGDVATSDRFDRQLAFLSENQSVDVVGSYTEEFTTTPDDSHTCREVPTAPSTVEIFARSRTPVHQTSVMFRRQAVLDVGNYSAMARMEDYDLWVRMLVAGKSIANIPDVLAKAHADKSLYARRGGFSYLCDEVRLQWRFYQIGFLSGTALLRNLIMRAPVRLLPRSIRKHLYRRLLRTDAKA